MDSNYVWLWCEPFSDSIVSSTTTVNDEYESDLRSNEQHLGSSENQTWKNSGLYGIRTHDLCDTGAVLYQLSQQANWEVVIMLFRNKPVKWWVNVCK